MKDLYKTYKSTREKILNRINEIKCEIEHNVNTQYNTKLLKVYEIECMEITQTLCEIKDYLKEVSK